MKCSVYSQRRKQLKSEKVEQAKKQTKTETMIPEGGGFLDRKGEGGVRWGGGRDVKNK